MRERLIELCDTNCGYVNEIPAEKFADYLIDNGVVAFPCKIGDTVYITLRNEHPIPLMIKNIAFADNDWKMYGANEKYFGHTTIPLNMDKTSGVKWYKTEKECINEREFSKINLLAETIAVLNENGKTPEDVLYVFSSNSEDEFYADWNDFFIVQM